MARYGQAYKDRIVARLLPPESSAVGVVSREVGVSVATLERWRAEALVNGAEDRRGGERGLLIRTGTPDFLITLRD